MSSSRPKTLLAVIGSLATEILSIPSLAGRLGIAAFESARGLSGKLSFVLVRPDSTTLVIDEIAFRSAIGLWIRRAGSFSRRASSSVIMGRETSRRCSIGNRAC
jgi:hypothetical protein